MVYDFDHQVFILREVVGFEDTVFDDVRMLFPVGSEVELEVIQEV